MALRFLRCAPIRYALQQHNCTCKVFVSVKIHDSASVSSGLLLSSSRVLKNMRPNIQVPHNNGCSAKVVQITVLKIIIISDNYKAMHICITDHTSWLNNYACTYISYCSVKLSLNLLAKPSYSTYSFLKGKIRNIQIFLNTYIQLCMVIFEGPILCA